MTISINGTPVTALADTGSEVSTMPESWFRNHLSNVPLQETQLVTLRAANGLQIPYCGIVEVEIVAFNNTVQRALFLVVKDSSNVACQQRRAAVPIILGMNLLPSLLFPLGRNTAALPSTLRAIVREVCAQSKPVTGIARLATPGKTYIPPQAAVTVRITGPQKTAQPLLAEPLATRCLMGSCWSHP